MRALCAFCGHWFWRSEDTPGVCRLCYGIWEDLSDEEQARVEAEADAGKRPLRQPDPEPDEEAEAITRRLLNS